MTSQESPGFFARLGLIQPKKSVAKDNDALRIGILGAANIAPNALIGPAKSIRSIVVVSVAARDESKAKAFAEKYGIPTTHASYDALIEDPTIDCIYNPLPNGLHYVWTKKALTAGKHVLLEKPATSNADQIRDLVNVARENSVVLLEALHYRYHPAALHFRSLLQEHIAKGHPLTKVEATMSFPFFMSATDIRFNYELGGGVVMDAGCYTINAIRYFTGLEVDTVEEAKPKIISKNVDGRMDGVLSLKGSHSPGVKATFVASLTNSFFSLQTYQEIIPTFTAETEDKVFTFGVYLLPSIYHYISIKDKKTGKTEKVSKVYADGYSTYKYQLEAFVRAVKNGGRDTASIPGWVTGEESIQNMIVIDKVYTKANMELRK